MQKNSVGKIMPNISYKIVDSETSNCVDTGSPGELLLKYDSTKVFDLSTFISIIGHLI